MAKKKAAAPAKPQRKPNGFAEFSKLMKKLIKVPKAEVDRLEEQRKAKQE